MINITIVMPAYNVAHYIPRAIESVLQQDYEHWELIIINDGSTDNTLDVIESFAQKDSRIKWVNQENQGVSAARNRGLSLAQGRYITFLDADDFYEKHYLASMSEPLERQDADMTFCKYRETDGEIILKESPSEINQLWHDSFIEHLAYVKDAIHPMACMYRLDLIKRNEIVFNRNYSYGEDQEFLLHYAYCATKIVFVPLVLYNYFYRQGSLSHQQIPYTDLIGELDSLYWLEDLVGDQPRETKEAYAAYIERRRQGVLNNIRRYYWSLLRSKQFDLLLASLDQYETKYHQSFNPTYSGIQKLTLGIKVKIISSRSRRLWHFFAK